MGVLRLFLLALLALGCGGTETNFVQSPQDQSSHFKVQLLQANYEPVSEGVRLQWFFSGQGTVKEFRILKGLSQDSFFEINRVNADQISQNSETLSFLDQDIYAGENHYYKIELEPQTGEKVSSDVLIAKIPGARVSSIRADEIKAHIDLFWTRAEDATAYELVRQIGEASPEVVFVSRDASVSSFVDQGLTGNEVYTYFLYTIMADGRRLKSSGYSTGFYRQSIVSKLGTLPENLIRLSLDWAKSNAPLALIYSPQTKGIAQFETEYLRDEGHASSTNPRELVWFSTPIYKFRRLGFDLLSAELDALAPVSISFDGPSLQRPSAKLFVAGIDAQTLKLYVFEKIQGNVQVSWQADLWEIENGDGKTAVSNGDLGRIYVASSGHLQMFDENFETRGDVALPFQQTPFDVVGATHTIWASLPNEGRLLRGAMVFDNLENLVDISWQDITLPLGAKPLGLDANSKDQIMVLDVGNGEVLVYDTEGQLVTKIIDVGTEADFTHPNGTLQGDLCASIISSEGVFVIDAKNTIRYFGDSTAPRISH